jgi:MinD-like ATPase involved in chromosome partitioning or flagellar assembly
VVLAELRPGQGRIRHDLNLSEQRNLADLLGLPAGEISRSRVGETLITYSGGLRLLLPSNELSELKLAAHATQFESLAQRLAFMAQFVIYDFGAGMNGSSSPLARTFCRELIVVVEPARAAIMQAWAMFEELARLGIGRERILCVANYRASGSHVLDPEQLQDQVGRPLAAVIPPAAETLALARREHVIPVLMRPEPSMRQHFVALAQQVMAQAPSAHR